MLLACPWNSAAGLEVLLSSNEDESVGDGGVDIVVDDDDIGPEYVNAF